MYIVSIDIPSGLDSDNGIAFPVAISANDTITFGHSKVGMYLADGKDYCGNIIVKDIGLYQSALDEIVKKQIERVKRYVADEDITALPVIVTLHQEGTQLVENVPIVPIMILPSALFKDAI